MAPSRFNKVGLQGRKDSANNSLDTFIQTFEFPVVAVASAAEQDTGVTVPSGFAQVVSALLKINTPEATAATKTVNVGITGSGGVVLNAADVSTLGVSGAPVQEAFSGGGNFTYTLAGADFAELDAICVVTVLGAE